MNKSKKVNEHTKSYNSSDDEYYKEKSYKKPNQEKLIISKSNQDRQGEVENISLEINGDSEMEDDRGGLES